MEMAQFSAMSAYLSLQQLIRPLSIENSKDYYGSVNCVSEDAALDQSEVARCQLQLLSDGTFRCIDG